MRALTLYDLFVRNGRNTAADTAIVFNNKRTSFATLLEQVDHLSEWLSERGISAGDRIAVLTMNHPGFLRLFGAAAKLGAILVPLNWRLSQQELGYILDDATPAIMFADETHYTTGREICEPRQIPLSGIDQTPGPGNHASKPQNRPPAVSVDQPVCIIYTAAVEGVPRGAVLSHTNLINANMQVIASMGLTSRDVNLATLPLFHITGMNLALAVMHQGGTNVIMKKFNEQEAAALTAAEGVTLWGSFPPILQRMTAELQKTSLEVPTLKYVVGLDGPENISAFEQCSQAKFWILYGQSETSGFVTFSPASEKPGTAGRQGPLSNFSIVDADDTICHPGEVGEIVVRGPLVFQGYWNQKEINRTTFRNDWHHTGDLGQIDDDGYLIYKGRKPEKELIKPGGENVYPAEVEAVILQHPAVSKVSVIGVSDPKFGEGVKAVVVLKKEKQVTARDLIEFVGARIARYKKPSHVEFVKTLPMTGDAVDRDQVKALYGDSR